MEKKNTPDNQVFADKFDEDTGGMEGQGEGAEERRELTGTSFQYQRVGHCQRGGGTGKRERWGSGEQEHKERHQAYSGRTRQRGERVVMTVIS